MQEVGDDPDAILPVPFWCNIAATFYYENNFNSFPRALVVQMELIVVNNWHLITEMYVERTSVWARFYFVTVYFGAVVVVMNVLTAFVLEAFISQYERNEVEIKRILKLTEQSMSGSPYDNVLQEAPRTKTNELEERMHAVIGLFKVSGHVMSAHVCLTLCHYHGNERRLKTCFHFEHGFI